jgi:hypothetical protein
MTSASLSNLSRISIGTRTVMAVVSAVAASLIFAQASTNNHRRKMPNIHRGEISALIGGEEKTLCLTLGALAELEARLQAGDLTGLAERFGTGRISARDLAAILGAGLRGAGNAITDDDLARMSIEGGLRGAAEIAARLLRATFGESA